MKKTFAILLGLLVGASVFAQGAIKFESKGSSTFVVNEKTNGRYICRDNVRFINETEDTVFLKVYGKKTADSEREFICMLAVKGHDTCLKSGDNKLKKYKIVEAECTNGTPVFETITCEHNDMYFYISDFKPNPRTTPTAVNDR